jgi:hypothetical protein
MTAMEDSSEIVEQSTRIGRFLSSLAPGDQVVGERHFKQLVLPTRGDSLVRLVDRLRSGRFRRHGSPRVQS